MVALGNEQALGVMAEPADGGRYYSVGEAAARLGVSRVSIWRWVRAGRLPAAQLGHRTIRIHERDLDRLLVRSTFGRGLEFRRSQEAQTDELAPRARVRQVQSSEHVVQFYEADGFLVSAVSDYLGSALRADDAVVVIATAAHRAAFDERMSDVGIDVAAARARGRYVSLDAQATLSEFMVNGQPDPRLFRQVVGAIVEQSLERWPHVRAFGEMVALLVSQGQHAAAVRLEALWNDLQQRRTFSLMCAYPLSDLAGEQLSGFVREVCSEHSHVVPTETYTGLDASDTRLRAIALLQQKARSLELEIAARERTERELRRREAELRDFFEQGLMGLHWVDARGTIVWANEAELDLLGVTADEYIGRHIGEFYVDRDVAADVLARLSRREAIREYEVRLRRKDGTIKDVLVSSNVLWDGDTFVHTRCFTVDITPRKQAEQRLELQYAVTQALSDALTVVEASAAILGRVCTTLGWEAGVLWLVDQQSNVIRCQDFWRHAHSDLSEFEGVSRGSVFPAGSGLPGRVWSTGQPVWIADLAQENHFPRAPHAGPAGLRGAFAFPVHISDEVVGVLEFFSRTSETPDAETVALMAGIGGQLGQFVERKRAEAGAERERGQLREVFRRAPAAVALVCGSEHVFEFVNPTYVRSVGRHEAASLIGKPVREALPELESQGYVDLLDRVYRSGEAFVGQELSVHLNRASDGTLEEAFFNVLLQPSRDDNGQVLGVYVHAVDVSEQVQARRRVEDLAKQLRDQLDTHVQLNRELRDVAEDRDLALERLQRLIRARDEFLTSAAHDLKNPLANMKGQAQILRRRVLRSETVRADQLVPGLESLDGSATRMAYLVDDLLDAARLELGQPLELQRSRVDLVALARRAVSEHQQATERHTIRLDAATPSIHGIWDAQRLDRALTNLLENAIKYSPEGGEIVVAIQQMGDSVVLGVRDEGLGIPPGDLPHIFERFRRGTNVAGRIGGTGIGLASVRAVVETHGGSISVDSTEGQGTTFQINMPLGADDTDPHR